MSKISINTDGLKQSSQSISKRQEELQALNSRLESVINAIANSWDGTASEAYIRMMQKYLKQGREMEKVLREFQKYADTALTKFDSKDKQSANKINSSF